MIILVDAYNVLKQVLGKKTVSDSERRCFIRKLGRYAKRREHKVYCIFDGGFYEWVSKEVMNGVVVIYSGMGHSADDYIKEYLRKNKLSDILLISSDRELRVFASRLDVESICSKEFYEIMKNRLSGNAGQEKYGQVRAIKLTQNENEELDKLMQGASNVIQYKSQDFVNNSKKRARRSFTLSKQEKKIIKILKKL